MGSIRSCCLGFAGLLVLYAGAASADTHCVPSSFSASCDDSHATIQAAIGDRKKVEEGATRVVEGTYLAPGFEALSH